MAASRNLRRRTFRRPVKCPGDLHDYTELPTQHRSQSRVCPAPERFQAAFGFAWPYTGRPLKDDLSTWTVTDDWPDRVPVTASEVDIFEAWFGDVFDALFGPCQ